MRATDVRGRRTAGFLVAALLAAGCGIGLAPAASARDGAARTGDGWERACERRASRNEMRQKLRRTFIRQCVAGYRINANRDLHDRRDLPDRKEKL